MRWAMLLAWAPWIPTFFGLGRLFIGMSRSRAMGLVVVAGEMVEMLVLWGIATLVITQIIAIVWLFRSFSKNNVFRSLISFFSICASGLMLLFVGAFLWMTWSHAY